MERQNQITEDIGSYVPSFNIRLWNFSLMTQHIITYSTNLRNLKNEIFLSPFSDINTTHTPVPCRLGEEKEPALPNSSIVIYNLSTVCPLYPWVPHPQAQPTMEQKYSGGKKMSILNMYGLCFLSLFHKWCNITNT